MKQGKRTRAAGLGAETNPLGAAAVRTRGTRVEGQLCVRAELWRRSWDPVQLSFYSKSNWRLLQDFRQRTYMIWLRIQRSLWQLCEPFVLECGPEVNWQHSPVSELRKLGLTTAKNIHQNSHYRKQHGGSPNTSSYLSSEYIFRGNEISVPKRAVYSRVYCDTVHNGHQRQSAQFRCPSANG